LINAGDHGGVDGAGVSIDAGFRFEVMDEVGLGVPGGMDAEVGEVEEEGGVLVIADELDGAVGEVVGEVGAGRDILLRIGMEVEMGTCGDEADVKAPGEGMMFSGFTEMPFSEDGGGVASGFEALGENRAVEGEFGDIIDGTEGTRAPVEAIDVADGVDARARAVLSGHESGAGRLAIGATGVGGCAAEAFAGHLIDVGRFVIAAAVTGEVGIAEVIGEDEDDVGGTVGLFGGEGELRNE